MFLVIKEKYFISFRFVSSFSMFAIKRKMFHIVHAWLLLRERVRMALSTSVLQSRI